jgi:hypothetical protein
MNDEFLYNLSQLSRALEIDRSVLARRLAKLKPKDGPGNAKLYPLHAVFRELSGGSVLETERQILNEQLRIARSKAEAGELNLAKIRGELVSIEEVATTVEKEYNYIRARLRAVPINLALRLSYASTPAECQHIVHDAIDEALTDLVADGEYKLSNEERMRQIDFATNGHDQMRIDENGRMVPHRPDLVAYREQLLNQNPDLKTED